jgi:aspartate 1-decarboxylase
MRRQLFKSKLHRATVTQADVDYEGSVTVDQDLLEAADICQYEAVHLWNVTRGTRLMTYALNGPRGSGIVCVNGAAAHLAKPGDRIIIATFCDLEDAEARRHVPRVVLLDDRNGIRERAATEVPGPLKRVV